MVLNVVVPRNLSGRQRDLLEELGGSLTDENLRPAAEESLFAKVRRVPLIRLAVRAPAEAGEQVLAACWSSHPGESSRWTATASWSTPSTARRASCRRCPRARPRWAAFVLVEGSEVPDDWAERWKRFHVPVLIGGRLWLRPPWRRRPSGRSYRPEAGPLARRSGRGPTRPPGCASSCFWAGAAGSFADLGCGSGVLAIAAAKLGFGPVTAVDSDRGAIDATTANATANGAALDRVERVNLREQPPPEADVVAANLMLPLLLRVAELIERPPRR